MKKAYVVGTCDTKFEELKFVADLIRQSGVEALLVDVGTKPHEHSVDITSREVAACHPSAPSFLDTVKERGEAVGAMGEALAAFLPGRGDVGGVVGLGGSGGTSIVTSGMRALPLGMPKIMVSTMASGNVAPYVGPNDIAMIYSVTDVAGINKVSRVVLANAANALAGMLKGTVPAGEDRPLLGMTMFGVTTPCVDMVRHALESDFDCLVFHATGAGGQSFEKLVDSGMMKRVLDVTTTEICDHLMGGVLSAGEDRLGAFARTVIPYVGSVGALDMVNFGAMETVPEKYKNRKLYVHNPQVTLMRTTPEENTLMGEWIGKKLNAMTGPVRFLLPLKGVSMIDAPGQAFYWPEADEALFAALERTVQQSDRRRLVKLPLHVNDPEFAAALVENYREINP
ncbi:MAG: Tm-1-like ATP-binding domain-containing protein [Synergistaceae bacterium]|nr:Tm-1-like ATP-binding domain-containing protein [Synergistaceae bacterium]